MYKLSKKKRSEWALRLLHELTYWNQSVFLTLTYHDASLPKNYSLRKKDLVDFLKRLRKNSGRELKYYACGEYGSETYRPHYHLILFGIGLSDEDKILIMKCWQWCDWSVPEIQEQAFGLVEDKSIMYVCRYVSKKMYDDDIAEYEMTARERPFIHMSKGLGKRYALDNAKNFTKDLKLHNKEMEISLPRYYVKVLKIDQKLIKEQAIEREKESIEKLSGIRETFVDFYKLYPDKSIAISQEQARKNRQIALNRISMDSIYSNK